MKHYDPIAEEQILNLSQMLGEKIEGQLLEGFLIMCSRLVDNFGHHRTLELERTFLTNTEIGKQCLKRSLVALAEELGSYEEYAANFPVSIIPPLPAFPMLKILGIELMTDFVYRVLDSNTMVHNTDKLMEDYIADSGELPWIEPPQRAVLRAKPKFTHWCSYEKFDSPVSTQESLQILPHWSNCQLRATIATSEIKDNAFMAYNGDKNTPFFGYFYEPVTQDHPPMEGGHIQINVFDAPKVAILEKWDVTEQIWKIIWAA